MIDHRRNRNHGAANDSSASAVVSRVLKELLDAISRFLNGLERPASPMKIGSTAIDAAPVHGAAPSLRTSFLGYVNIGLFKIEQARRLSAMTRQYTNAITTIKLTSSAIRNAPRPARNLFSNYGRVLRDAKRRVKTLHLQIIETERHLRKYNPNVIGQEIASLQGRMDAAGERTQRAELEMILEARRDLLASVQSLDDKLVALGAQLSAIATALEVNHIRVVTISSRTTSRVEADMVTLRIAEATEQLALLEETLRELDAA